MKKNIISMVLITIPFALASNASAQKDSSGIYKTASDFQQKKLSYAINYKTEKHKIKDNLLFHGAEIKVVHEGQTYKLDKNSTYGYKSSKGEVFRFVGNNEYKVLNPGESPMLYAYTHPTSATKGNFHYISDYYFSTDAASTPQALTKENLKKAFPDNHKFHDALDATFKSDEGLSSYDNFHKMYKVNHILEASRKQ
ncbi:hypothetical protein [Chitinophaga sp. CF418]|uniref:hypothetical protein n=1 Tax=Chitinophaga sp. CF418 TaxID=1855287 RepID=UPI000913BC74|nr:hypothetical protein [Chitinophaga sp. CF418]SHN34277.1 hypothetical protein SAMN05216311_109266 [Chitinophaga sp. CF418]